MGRKQRRFEALESFVEPRAKLVRQSVCSGTFLRRSVETAGLILLYYVFSISLTFYNQRFIHAFRFPLSITMFHLLLKFVMATTIRSVYTCITGQQRVTLSWKLYAQKISAAGITSSLDIAMSNWSFEFITITLYTMTKSTAVVFILLFSLVFGLERMRYSLIAVVLFIAVGLFMFTFELTQFNLEGFLMVLSASVLCGLRWTLSQLVMQKNELGLGHPLDMMYHIQPWMMVALLPLAVGFEGVQFSISPHTFGYDSSTVLLNTVGLLLLGGCLAFMMEMSEFLLVGRTSSLTISLAGVVKEVCTLVLAALVNGDRMSTVNALGLVVCLVGLCIHIVLKAVDDKTMKTQSLDEEVRMQLLTERESEEEEEVS